MLNRIADKFPQGFTPNPSQEYILSEIDKALEKGYKFIVINAPTATGKSLIAKTLANSTSEAPESFVKACKDYSIYDEDKHAKLDPEVFRPFGTAVLTVTKALQDQYIASFNDGSILKGKSNYECSEAEGLSCENGKCSFQSGLMQKCMRAGRCPYFNQRNEAVTNKCSFYTYAMFDGLPEAVKRKEIIVCDEAAELEDELVNRFTFSITFADLRRNGVSFLITPRDGSHKDKYIEWMDNVYLSVSNTLANVKASIKKQWNGSKKMPVKLYRKYLALKDYQLEIERFMMYFGKSDYIVETSKEKITFVPYEVDQFADEFFRHGDTVILMSATIVNHKKFAKTLGIDDYYYIEAKSPLDPKKAPITCASNFRINYKNRDIMIPKILDVVDVIVKQLHPNEKGIIHTHSMAIQKMVKERFGKDPRFLFREDGVRNEHILLEHENSSEPTILVSPSMTHGVDLKGDLGRFQVILKAPYLPLGDKRIKRKFDEDPEWYADKMLGSLVQASGRCNRLHDDVAKTYIMDGTIVDAIQKNTVKLPKYFLERFV